MHNSRNKIDLNYLIVVKKTNEYKSVEFNNKLKKINQFQSTFYV